MRMQYLSMYYHKLAMYSSRVVTLRALSIGKSTKIFKQSRYFDIQHNLTHFSYQLFDQHVVKPRWAIH